MSEQSDTIDADRRRGAMAAQLTACAGNTSAGQQVAGSTPVVADPVTGTINTFLSMRRDSVTEYVGIVHCNNSDCGMVFDMDTIFPSADEAITDLKTRWNRRAAEISPSRPLALPPSSANCHLAEKCQLRHLSIDINKDLPNTPQEGILQIAIERNRQIRQGFTPEHDDQHTDGSLARCAQLILMACEGGRVNHRDLNRECDEARNWYFGRAIRVARRHTLVQCLAIAGAMIAAEIDRLTRLQRSSQLPPLSPVENPDLNRSEQRQQSEERDPIAAKDGSVQLS